jgi:YVTN family beta-propeller protein
MKPVLPLAVLAVLSQPAIAQQAPWAGKDVKPSRHDRVYAAEQFSNTVSVTDPIDNSLVGVIRLGDPQPANFSPLYKGQVLVHGMGFAPDGKTLAIVSIGSNSVTFIDTETNAVKHTTYIGRSPHEAFYTPDGKEVWVTVRGEDYLSVIDAATFEEKARLKTPGGPGMTIFSPDGKYGYVCSSFNPDLVVFDVASHQIVGHVAQPSPFCPNIAASPDGKQVWFTLKDVGKTVAFDAKPPFAVLKVIDTGPITNHVNFARTRRGQFAYVTIGGLNTVKVFRTDNFEQVATIPVGALPHGVWPNGDGSRIYVGLENADRMAAIDTATNRVVGDVPIGQAPQAIAYVPGAVTGARHAEPAASRPGRQCNAPDALTRERQRSTDEHHAVRPGPHPGIPRVGDRRPAEAPVRHGAFAASRRLRPARAHRQLHVKPGRVGHRQRGRTDPADRGCLRGIGPALACRRRRDHAGARTRGSGPVPLTRQLPGSAEDE